MRRLWRALFLSVLLITVAVALLWSVSTTAQMVKYYGRVMDASKVPPSAPPSGICVPGSPGSLSTPTGLPGPSNWGSLGWNLYKLSPGDFIRREGCLYDGTPDRTNFDGILPASGQSSICVGAPVHLPTGASLKVATLYFNNTYPAQPSMALWKYDAYGVATVVAPLTPPSCTTGDAAVQFTLNPSETIDNFAYSYYVLAILERSTIDPNQLEKIYSLQLGYALQVSPAPSTASFDDVPTSHPWFQWIEALKASGITAGCSTSPSLFCPDAPVTRGQMAIFLSRGLGLYWPY